MGDVVDKANDAVDVCTEEAQRRIRKQAAPEQHPSFDGQHCVDCDTEIPAARLAWGKVRCVSCQEDLEQRAQSRLGLTTEEL